MELCRVGAEVRSLLSADREAKRDLKDQPSSRLSRSTFHESAHSAGSVASLRAQENADWGALHCTIAFDEIITCDNYSSWPRSAA